jgi:hypothetical protein
MNEKELEEWQKAVDKKDEVNVAAGNEIIDAIRQVQLKYKLTGTEVIGLLQIMQQFFINRKQEPSITVITGDMLRDVKERVNSLLGQGG